MGSGRAGNVICDCFQPRTDGVGGHRLAEEMTLSLMAAMTTHEHHLFFRVDALHHDLVGPRQAAPQI
jgi:hypothetical protein